MGHSGVEIGLHDEVMTCNFSPFLALYGGFFRKLYIRACDAELRCFFVVGMNKRLDKASSFCADSGIVLSLMVSQVSIDHN